MSGELNNVRAALQICRDRAGPCSVRTASSQEYPVMRHMANLESVLTYEGTVEVHTLVIGKAITAELRFGEPWNRS